MILGKLNIGSSGYKILIGVTTSTGSRILVTEDLGNSFYEWNVLGQNMHHNYFAPNLSGDTIISSLAGSSSGLFKVQDRGNTVTQLDSSFTSYGSVYSLSATPTLSYIIYAVSSSTWGRVIRLSADQENFTSALIAGGSKRIMGCYISRTGQYIISPSAITGSTDREYVYSTNYGASYGYSTYTSSSSTLFHSSSFVTDGGDGWYLLGSIGNRYSTSSGPYSNFSAISGNSGVIRGSSTGQYKIYTPSGIMVSNNGSNTFTPAVSGSDIGYPFVSPSGKYMAATGGTSFYLSQDFGETFLTVSVPNITGIGRIFLLTPDN